MIGLLQLAFGTAVFLATIWVGRRRPEIPLLAFAWIIPYLAYNMFFGIPPWLAPARPLCFGMAVLVIMNRKTASAASPALWRWLSVYLGTCSLMAFLGILRVYIFAEFIGEWFQSPLLRVFHSTGMEMLHWLLLIAPVTISVIHGFAQRLVRHIILAGLFFCALGMVQFGLEEAVAYDPFPMVRGDIAGPNSYIESTMRAGLDTRITSLCGEPREFAAFACFWFLLTATLGKYAGFSFPLRILLCGLFLITLVLTGSRTGFLILVMVGFVGWIATIFTGQLRRILPFLLVGSLLAAVFAALITLQIGSFGARVNSYADLDSNIASTLTIAGVNVPVEWTDAAAVLELSQHPSQILIGAGPGLWQYYINPYEIAFVQLIFPGTEDIGLESVKSNIGIIFRLCDIGLVGLILMTAVLFALYKCGKIDTSPILRKDYMVSFWILAVLSQLAGPADLLAFFTLGAAVGLYREAGFIRPTRKCEMDKAQRPLPDVGPQSAHAV